MVWEPKADSAAAQLDEFEHRAFMERCAKELGANEPPLRAVAPIRSGITKRQLDKQIRDLLKRMGEIIGKELRTLRQRVAELEQREWLGVWTSGKSYAKNAIVSHDGSAWLALRQYPEGKPGDGANTGWKLIVKRGRDAKDAPK